MKCLRRTVRHYWKYSYEAWTQPVLTSENTQTSDGIITTTASSYYNANTAPYKIMLGSVSSTVDSNYWQINYTTGTSWLKIVFPYQLKISSLSIYTRPRDNYTGKTSVYTGEDRSVLIGSVNTGAALTQYTVLNEGEITTDTLYFYITDQNSWYGLQNLQITAQKQAIVAGTEQDYDFYTDDEVSELPKKTVIKYWKYQYNTWLQQTLSSDGTLGEEYFAVSSNYVESGHPAYYMFDNNSSSYYSCYKNDGGNYYTFYNPNPLNVSKIVFNFANDKSYSEFSTTTVQASNNGSSWISLENSWNTDGTLTINNNDYYYRYYRIYQVYWWTAYSCSITATERSVIEGTPQDYDFTTTEYVYYGINQ